MASGGRCRRASTLGTRGSASPAWHDAQCSRKSAEPFGACARAGVTVPRTKRRAPAQRSAIPTLDRRRISRQVDSGTSWWSWKSPRRDDPGTARRGTALSGSTRRRAINCGARRAASAVTLPGAHAAALLLLLLLAGTRLRGACSRRVHRAVVLNQHLLPALIAPAHFGCRVWIEAVGPRIVEVSGDHQLRIRGHQLGRWIGHLTVAFDQIADDVMHPAAVGGPELDAPNPDVLFQVLAGRPTEPGSAAGEIDGCGHHTRAALVLRPRQQQRAAYALQLRIAEQFTLSSCDRRHRRHHPGGRHSA